MNQVATASTTPRFSVRAIVIPLALLLFFFALSFTPRVQEHETLKITFWAISAGFLVWYLSMLFNINRNHHEAGIRIVLVKAHYVQMLMHLSIFIYWGQYWPQVYDQAVLILAQLVFVNLIDVLFKWTRGQEWLLGFGRFPIIFSTNLFLWFRDDWFYYQFLMVAFGVFAKEVFTWARDDRRVHIFNPSAISLAVASTLLIVTNMTEISWGPAISNTLGLPPYMYILIFMTGLVVQYLFHVTLVTLATAITLLLAGWFYYQVTDVFFFLTSDIPIAVFLGLHLLVTDPVTSPKNNFGKILFGVFYALSVMLLFEVLELFGAPTFYDKLLSVPLLNASVILLDRVGRRFTFDGLFKGFRSWSLYRLNLLHMSIWIVVFLTWFASGHVGVTHPGREYAFWQNACEQDKRNACENKFKLTSLECEKDNPVACAQLGVLYSNGEGTEVDTEKAFEMVDRACSLGLEQACNRLDEFRR